MISSVKSHGNQFFVQKQKYDLFPRNLTNILRNNMPIYDIIYKNIKWLKDI